MGCFAKDLRDGARERRGTPAASAAGALKRELLGRFIFYFRFAHCFQLFRDVATFFGDLGVFDDVVVNAIFVIALHAGNDALNSFNAHARLDVVAQVVQQQDALLVITDLFLNVLNFTLQFVLTTIQANKLQYVLERRLSCFHFYTPNI